VITLYPELPVDDTAQKIPNSGLQQILSKAIFGLVLEVHFIPSGEDIILSVVPPVNAVATKIIN
jgi:hypothetical protein